MRKRFISFWGVPRFSSVLLGSPLGSPRFQVVAFSSLRTGCKPPQPGIAIMRNISRLVAHETMAPEAGRPCEGCSVDAIYESEAAAKVLHMCEYLYLYIDAFCQSCIN